uniref:Uncharacterized protein n=1 Tax=Candidatus Kentrum sp. MB TaxID=2138164 RepID=A0A451B7F9_9GAMM|nr:MAG: hypothetical protein BECKMB1821G_GA0114241_100418 [Candidatus Kentron sp. MB]VFK28350.1 MAG: hypothetical protein BECKMB1821I_GA0114274_100617 [Candidatus Kentron sp. MB]VFK74214.1 MAG: hypothetical protein BECKMB1821H_GA0114242_100235 [Candidatus Kentron sp. MB]
MYLKQKQILESISRHLDDLMVILRWALLLAVGFWWTGVHDIDSSSFLGIKIKQTHALWVAIIFYLTINLAVLDRLLRISDLVKLADDENFHDAFSRLALHPWMLNPFSYFGASMMARAHSAKGFGALIIIWWICNSSLYSLANNPITQLVLSDSCFKGLF